MCFPIWLSGLKKHVFNGYNNTVPQKGAVIYLNIPLCEDIEVSTFLPASLTR